MPSGSFAAFYGIVDGLVVVLPASLGSYSMAWGTSLAPNLDNSLDPWEPVYITGPNTVEFSVYNGLSSQGEALVEGGRAFLSNITTYSTGDPAPSFTSQAFVCFLEGSLIATPAGEVPVERLGIGDAVLTADGRAVPVLWIGRQRVPHLALLADARQAPVRIGAGALGPGLPHADLDVTAEHGMVWEGLLVNAGALVNGTTIRFLTPAELPQGFTCYHIETEAHEVVLANGAPAESFVDYVPRARFDNHAEYLALHGAPHGAPHGAGRVVAEMPRPRISAQRMLPRALRRRLGLPPFEAAPADEASALLARLARQAA